MGSTRAFLAGQTDGASARNRWNHTLLSLERYVALVRQGAQHLCESPDAALVRRMGDYGAARLLGVSWDRWLADGHEARSEYTRGYLQALEGDSNGNA